MKASVAILILLAVIGLAAPAQSQNQNLQLRLEKALQDARSVSNLEVHVVETLWFKGHRGAPKPLDQDFALTNYVSYFISGGKYRTELNRISSSTNAIRNREAAFDGKLYSELKTDTGQMVQQDGDMPGDVINGESPLVGPFLFLSKQTEENFPCRLRFKDLSSSDVLNGLILPDGKSSNGILHLSFPGLFKYGTNGIWRINLDDSDSGFIPKTISEFLPNGFNTGPTPAETTYTLLGYTNLGTYHFPTKMTFVVNSLPPTGEPVVQVKGVSKIVSIETPRHIAEATFRLNESKAKFIWNTRESKGYGVGISLGEQGSNVVVKRIVLNSPAGRQDDLKVGDKIVRIADNNENGMAIHAGASSLARAIGLLRGAKGTTVRLTFVRAGDDDSYTKVASLARGDVRERMNGGRLLTNGSKAPDIEMVELGKRTTERLSNYTGELVVLEFWASWCPPCQKAMADLQTAFSKFPGWKDRVVIIAASVDDTEDIAAKHIAAKGWNRTHNVWLKTETLKAFPVAGIPNAYIIDPRGIIVASGSVDEGHLNLVEVVNRQLGMEGRASK